MLLDKDVKSSFDREYLCDRCNKKLLKKERMAIYAGIGSGNLKKRWDLCHKCFRALERGIAKGIRKEVSN